MPRQKKLVSAALTKALVRIAGLKAIGPKVDLGKKLTLHAYEAEAAKLVAEIEAYNTLLAQLDAKLNAVTALEKSLGAMSVLAMRRIAADFGTDSDEYEKIGGKRDSERN